MKNKIMLVMLMSVFTSSVLAMGEDDPIITKVMIDQLERRSVDGDDPLVLEGEISIGKDLNKFVAKFDIEQVNGETHERSLEALYSRAVDPYWNFQVGWRQDQEPKPERDWLVLGFEGVAPYWLEVDSALYIGESGQMNLSIMAEYEWMLTQQWVLSPELEVNFHRKDDEEVGTGSGLSTSQLGLRLRYEIKRELAPYIGVNWIKKYGSTADFATAEGEEVDDTQFVVGIRAWF